MRLVLVGVLLASVAVPVAAQERGSGQSVTVTGIRLPEHRQRLRDCLARHCPVNEDVDATLAYAEALMLSGEYRDARSTISASLRRNRDEAARYPEPVADLYRSHA